MDGQAFFVNDANRLADLVGLRAVPPVRPYEARGRRMTGILADTAKQCVRALVRRPALRSFHPYVDACRSLSH